MTKTIDIRGAREHNLKNISLSLPKDELIVITGLSGSGKSSLAFDTLYAEGQRRYVESLSAYARQFLELMQKPDVDSIDGLSPAISIEQKTTSKNPRSTVGTVTEIYDYLRLLFARIGIPHSPATGLPIEAQTITQMVDHILSFPLKTKLLILAPIVQDRKGEHQKEREDLIKKGFQRVRVNGHIHSLAEMPSLNRKQRHTLEVVVDRLVLGAEIRSRLTDSLETALHLGQGIVHIHDLETEETRILSSRFACPVSGFTLGEIEPRLFSFNSPQGACSTCDGLGIISSTPLIFSWRSRSPAPSPLSEEDEETEENNSPCSACQGHRLKPEALCVKINTLSITDVCQFSIGESLGWFERLSLSPSHQTIGQRILKEIKSRLLFLKDVGLDYLTLSRCAGTLSGGESQRIRLASQIGSGLTGVLYVLDEPSIGLHQRDNRRLLDTLKRLKDLGNTVVVVEHDEEAIRAADHVVDMGPRAGRHGGEVVAAGSPEDIMNCPHSLTGRYLTKQENLAIPPQRRPFQTDRVLALSGATSHNLKNVSVEIPLQTLTCVTGVSGGGKSTLILGTLYAALSQKLNGSQRTVGAYKSLHGMEHLDKVIEIDQAPIGRTPRSNPATYIGAFTPLREWFSQLPESQARGYRPGRFSFNVRGGRCEACQGDGTLKIEMHFLPDVYVQCDQCKGRRYNRETLEIQFKNKSIADILEMTIDDVVVFFQDHPSLVEKFRTLQKVGLGYIQVGQQATTLSGGEAQRIKLAKELSRRATGRTIYFLDEPTTGLHFEDIKRLMEVLQALVNQGNTVVLIEHNVDVMKTADWIIDMGPEGGNGGGEVLVAGPPEMVAKCSRSHTAPYLKAALEDS